MPLLPKQRSSFKTSPRPAQPNLESHLTAPSPQQWAFLRPAQAKYTKKSLKYTKRVDINLHNWCNSSIAAITTTHPSPVNTGANTINANAQLASRKCSRLQTRWAPRHRPGQARSFRSRMPMSFAPPMRSAPGLHRISGHGRCSARHPCRIQPPKGVHGQQGEANAAKSKNGNAGWNPGTALPVRIGAKPERLAPARCGLNGFRRARGLSALPHLQFPWHALKGIGSFFL